MEDTTKVCSRAEQLCLKLQTIVSLYKDLQRSNSEEENLILLGTLRDVKYVLADKEQQEGSVEDVDKNLEELLDGLRSHAGIVALKTLVHDVKDIKENVEYLRKRIEEVEPRKLPSRPRPETCDEDPVDPKLWERLTQRRHELLSDVETTLKKSKKIRFHPSIGVTKTTKTERESKPVTKPTLSSVTIDKRLTNRVTKLEGFLVEKQARLSGARKSVVRTILSAKEAECELHNTESAINRSRIARRATVGSVDGSDQLKWSDDKNYGDLNVCTNCQTGQKEKDKFWGLATESADEEEYVKKILSMKKFSHDVTELNEDEANELFKVLELEDRQDGCSRKKSKVGFKAASPVKVQDSVSSKAYVIKQRPTGHAGHGTWATLPYQPNWLATETKGSHQQLSTAQAVPNCSNGSETSKRRGSRMRRWLEKTSEAHHHH